MSPEGARPGRSEGIPADHAVLGAGRPPGQLPIWHSAKLGAGAPAHPRAPRGHGRGPR